MSHFSPQIRHHLAARVRPRTRGFTLAELMVVVLMIGVFTALAMPRVANQMRERRTANNAEQIALTYRLARMRAMGRGSAVLVRFDPAKTSGYLLEQREAIVGGNGSSGCAVAPIASCTSNIARWNTDTLSQRIDVFNPSETTFVDFRYTDTNGTNNVNSAVDVCFAPSGTTWYRPGMGDSVTFFRLSNVPSLHVCFNKSCTDAAYYGIERVINLLPNSLAALTVSQRLP